MAEDSKTVAQAKPPKFVRNGNTAPIYVEGLSQMMIGFPNSRLIFHSLVMPADAQTGTPETRQIGCELVIPTAALVESVGILMNQLTGAREALKAGTAEWTSKVNAVMDTLQAVPTGSNALAEDTTDYPGLEH